MAMQSSTAILDRHLQDILVWLWTQDTQHDATVKPSEIYLSLVSARALKDPLMSANLQFKTNGLHRWR